MDRRKMTPDKRAAFAIMIARNAEAVYAEKRKIEVVKTEAIERAFQADLAVELIAEINDVSVEFVEKVKQKSSKNSK